MINFFFVDDFFDALINIIESIFMQTEITGLEDYLERIKKLKSIFTILRARYNRVVQNMEVVMFDVFLSYCLSDNLNDNGLFTIINLNTRLLILKYKLGTINIILDSIE